MRNGYAMCTAAGLLAIDDCLARLDEAGLARFRDSFRIGVHWDVEVTEAVVSTGARAACRRVDLLDALAANEQPGQALVTK
jgi:hypothetical protein